MPTLSRIFSTPVTSTNAKWVEDFALTPLNTAVWDAFPGGTDSNVLIPTACAGSGISTGMSYTFANSALVFSMGTTINAEYWLMSKATFTLPLDLYPIVQLSQRIANNNVYIELVEVDSTGRLVPNTVAGEIRNRAGVRYQGTSGTALDLESVSGDSPAAAVVTASTATSASPGHDLLIEYRNEDVILTTGVVDSTASHTTSGGRISKQVPDHTKVYKLRIRFKNGSSAPASNTDVSLFRIVLNVVQDISVEVSSGRGDMTPNKGMPVLLTGGLTGSSAIALQGTQGDNVALAGSQFAVGGTILSTVGGPAIGTTGRYGSLTMDLARRVIVQPLGNPQSHDFNFATLANTTETNVIAAVAATRHILTSINIFNADTVSHVFLLRDTTAGTVRKRFQVDAGKTLDVSFPSAGIPQAALNTNCTVQLNEAVTTTAPIVTTTSFRTTA